MHTSPIQQQSCMRIAEPAFTERRVSPAEVAADYAKINEVASQLKIMQDLLQEASHFGMSKELFTSFKRDVLTVGSELSVIQGMLTEKENVETRKRENKAFQKYLDNKLAPKALTTAEELNPLPDSIINKMPFQSAFAYILLDKYIPSQESALYALGRELNLAGYAQTLFSPLLEVIKTFNSSPIAYNLGSYIGQTSGTANFAYGYDMIKDRYEEERLQLRNDLQNATDAQELLQKIAQKIRDNNSLLESQKTQLLNVVQSYNDELDVCIEDMKNLMLNLNALVFIPGNSEYEASYTIMGSGFSIVALQNLEQLVVDGEINIDTGVAKGGLLNFFNTCLSDVQNYGDLAQTHQLMLELQMRAMQQEWSIVSGSLKLLHNIYRTLINGFT
ncbi:CT620/CT621 family type III secretion system effector [Chlamydia gallinacea]|uniref:Effector from type III secretion system family protein n=1 Tax=Chlamydia gallinacea TaxID=1457153 RepID=A0ABS7ITT0_9CHLA|nr:CT620/CT621 family type III secretion system effector [Chlamydia gallinacea]MBX6680111.1 effector from type III secretion system family protein [Chlamydia gallinacea]MBX6687343.1 effector from type III secretion system family protein [Chlamydia gallinacea]